MTAGHCDAQIARMRVLKGLPEDVYEYFSALEDVPDERFTLAVNHALKTRQWFPTPAELRADCDAVAMSSATVMAEPRMEDLVGGGHEVVLVNPCSGVELCIPVKRIWRFDCDDCADTGWRSRPCPVEFCGRRYEHAAHEWVEPCQCREWNPTIRRRKAAGAKYSHAPEKVGA